MKSIYKGSHHVSKKNAMINPLFETQSSVRQFCATVSSRPGHVGRADVSDGCAKNWRYASAVPSSDEHSPKFYIRCAIQKSIGERSRLLDERPKDTLVRGSWRQNRRKSAVAAMPTWFDHSSPHSCSSIARLSCMPSVQL